MKNDGKKVIHATAVLGSGLMGHGIGLVFALNGCRVSLYDIDQAILQGSLDRISRILDLFVETGVMGPQEKADTLSLIGITTRLEEAVADADYVTEAAPENLELKKALFERIDGVAREGAIIASNTSMLSITEIGTNCKTRDRFIITHWFNPPYLVPAIEVVKGEATSQETLDRTVSFLRDMGKVPVRVLKEVPGFLVNRIQTAMFREVLALLEAGVAAPEDIDRAVTGSFGFRLPIIGPLQTADLGGLDLWYKGAQHLYPFLDNSREPQGVLRERVEAGLLGRKTGRGFFEYGPEGGEERARDMKMLDLLRLITAHTEKGGRT